MKVLDLKGLVCPEPIMRLAREVRNIEEGEIFQVVATDPGTLSDIPMWAKNNKVEILETKREGDVIFFRLRKI